MALWYARLAGSVVDWSRYCFNDVPEYFLLVSIDSLNRILGITLGQLSPYEVRNCLRTLQRGWLGWRPDSQSSSNKST